MYEQSVAVLSIAVHIPVISIVFTKILWNYLLREKEFRLDHLLNIWTDILFTEWLLKFHVVKNVLATDFLVMIADGFKSKCSHWSYLDKMKCKKSFHCTVTSHIFATQADYFTSQIEDKRFEKWQINLLGYETIVLSFTGTVTQSRTQQQTAVLLFETWH